VQGVKVREGGETIWSAPILGAQSGEGDPALVEKKNGLEKWGG